MRKRFSVYAVSAVALSPVSLWAAPINFDGTYGA